MILSASLRVLRDCEGYPKLITSQIDGNVEAHYMNALIQIRSLNDFFIDRDHNRPDTMIISHFPGCSSQPDRSPTRPDAHHRLTHTFVAHKSWDAVDKDEFVGCGQMHKRELVQIGLGLFDGFEQFWADGRGNNIGEKLKPYARIYKAIYESNAEYLRERGP